MTSDLGTHKEDGVLSPLTKRTAQSGASTHHHRRGTGHVAQPRLGDLRSKPRAGRQPLARRARPRRRSCQAAVRKRRRALAPIGEAADILWTYTSPEPYDLLAHQRGWPPEQYGRFVGQALIAALLPPEAS